MKKIKNTRVTQIHQIEEEEEGTDEDNKNKEPLLLK